jgi:L-amino acid N-acyltransferase YncA
MATVGEGQMRVTVDGMRDGDWDAVRSIYEEGIADGDATFESEAPTWEEWDEGHIKECRLVARLGDCVVGWAALSPVYHKRRWYSGVAEVSVYVTASARHGGVGKTLLEAAISSSEEAGLWSLQAGIFPENTVSLALVESCGFRRIGIRERLGCMNGVWRDVVLVERRSPPVD